MYRVFEALDELVQTVEEAYGVPMTSNCMVPRQHTLALLDDIRNAIPTEVDDAQDVLDHRDALIDDAQREAHGTRAAAQDEAQRLVAEATAKAEALVARARDDAARIVDDAQREYDRITGRAEAEAERLVASGNESYQRSVDDGLAEQTRLVSESEVVRRATDEAQRLIDTAHSDSRKLRSDCDSYVDTKLAEFEQSLSGVLRTVSRDRAELRKGAGASGYGRGYDAE